MEPKYFFRVKNYIIMSWNCTANPSGSPKSILHLGMPFNEPKIFIQSSDWKIENNIVRPGFKQMTVRFADDSFKMRKCIFPEIGRPKLTIDNPKTWLFMKPFGSLTGIPKCRIDLDELQSKGQLILKCPFDVFKLTKKPNKNL